MRIPEQLQTFCSFEGQTPLDPRQWDGSSTDAPSASELPAAHHKAPPTLPMQIPAAAVPRAVRAQLRALQLSQGRLGSTCGDAEVGLVGGHVVDPVVLPGQDDVPVLQEHDPARKAKVGVGPLVDLVGHGDEDDEGKDVTVPGTGLTQCLCKTPRAAVGQLWGSCAKAHSHSTASAAGTDRASPKLLGHKCHKSQPARSNSQTSQDRLGSASLSKHQKQEVKLSLP